MGFRICYIAARLRPDVLAAAMGLEDAGTTDEQPYDQTWMARQEKSGWTILWSENAGFIEENSVLIAAASAGGDIIACEVNETVMWSSAERFSGGRSVWRVASDGEGPGQAKVTAQGTLPEEYAALEAELLAEQEAAGPTVDILFDLPLTLANREVGFRHDSVPKDGDFVSFTMLAPKQSAPRKGWLARLFG